MKKEETYYDLLKVDPKANVTEIVNAYHTARNAYSKDSLASYSLFTAEEAEQVLKKLEEAYMTLSNLDRKRDYDRKLASQPETPVATSAPIPAPPLAAPPVQVAQAASPAEPLPLPHVDPILTPLPIESSPGIERSLPSAAQTAAAEIPSPGITGAWLRNAREQAGLTLEDVSRLTKIPMRTLQAIENDTLRHLPARVYLQGFVSNLVKVYKVDAKITKLYIASIDALRNPAALA